jgi:hypothetical protein
MPAFRKKLRVLLHHPLHAADHRCGCKMQESYLHGSDDALKKAMRLVAIIVVVAIVYMIFGRGGEKQSPQGRIAEAQKEAALVQPASPSQPPPAASGSLRAPIDRTREVLSLVKKRNSE